MAPTMASELVLPDFSRPFEIETNASGQDMEVVLSQNGHPIAYINKPFADVHRGLSTYVKELLVVLLAVKKWSHNLKARPFIIHMDHQSHKHLLK